MQVLCLLHNAPANNAKFATFANKTQDKLPFLTHFAHVSLHIFRIYAHILHHCRLALKMISNFTMLTVCCVKMHVFFIPNCTIISGPTALTNPSNTPKCCRYARLQPVYCQLIVLTSNILRIGTVWLTPCLSLSIFRRPPAFLIKLLMHNN